MRRLRFLSNLASSHFLAKAKCRLHFLSNFTLVNLKTPSPHFLPRAKCRLYFLSNFTLVNLKILSPHFLAKAKHRLHFFCQISPWWIWKHCPLTFYRRRSVDFVFLSNFTLVNLKTASPHFLAKAKRRLHFLSNFTLVNLKTPSPHFLVRAKRRLRFFVKFHLSEFENTVPSLFSEGEA
jgi:hypothetical protein